MDCHHTLHHRPRSVAGLRDAASGASAIAGAGFTFTVDNYDVDSHCAGALPSASPSPSPAEAAPAFAEKTEVLRNSDVELRLTNRGGAISEVVLLNHIDDHNQRLILNSPDRMPIGAIVQKPEAASLPEFTLSRAPDGSVQFERDTPEHVSIRKKFSFPPTTQKKDNFLAQLDVNFRNDSAQPTNYPDYYVTLGSARPVHANDLSTYTHLIWCTAGKTKSIDVNWFAPQSSFLGLKKSAGHDFYAERLAGAEWAAVTNQFFATLFAPLDGKANAVWGRRFEIPRGEGVQPFAAVEGAMGMPGLTLQPGQNTTVRFEIYAGPKLYHRLAQLEHNEAEIMDFGVFKIICQALLNLMNLLHHYLGNYAVAILALTTIVKLCLWPLQNKANKSMRRMSALSPKMQELREKYKDDPTRMNQEVMKLYKDYGINPVSGCAPDADPDPDLLRSLHHAAADGGIAKRQLPLGARSFAARHRRSHPDPRLAASTFSRCSWP